MISKTRLAVVRKIALALPGVEESTAYGATAFRLHGQLLTCEAINKSAEPETLAVRIDFAQRDELIEAEPDVYYVTDHYMNYPCVLVRVPRINRDALRDLLGMAWKFVDAKAKRRRAPRKAPRRRVRRKASDRR
jgi:hypothetical protein